MARESDSRTRTGATANRCPRSYNVHKQSCGMRRPTSPHLSFLRASTDFGASQPARLSFNNMTTFPSAPPNSRTGSSGCGRMYLLTSVAFTSMAPEMRSRTQRTWCWTRLTPDVLKAVLRCRAHLAGWDCSSHFLARDTAETQDRASSTRVFVGMAWRRSVWSSFRCTSSTHVFFHRTVTLVSSVGVLVVTCCLVP